MVNLLARDPRAAASFVAALARPILVLPGSSYPDDASQRAFAHRALEAIRVLPGVETASLTSTIPFGSNHSDSVILAKGYQMPPGESIVSPNRTPVRHRAWARLRHAESHEPPALQRQVATGPARRFRRDSPEGALPIPQPIPLDTSRQSSRPRLAPHPSPARSRGSLPVYGASMPPVLTFHAPTISGISAPSRRTRLTALRYHDFASCPGSATCGTDFGL